VVARRSSGRNVGDHAQYCVGVRSVLGRHHGCELEISLCPPYRLFIRDYGVFDCGGMAFSETHLKTLARVAVPKLNTLK
jgi:hypothetical protein